MVLCQSEAPQSVPRLYHDLGPRSTKFECVAYGASDIILLIICSKRTVRLESTDLHRTKVCSSGAGRHQRGGDLCNLPLHEPVADISALLLRGYVDAICKYCAIPIVP